MRLALHLLIAAVVVPSFLFGASAFNYGQSGGRVINVDLVNDASAYLAIVANPASPHASCFVDTSTGSASIVFGSSAGCGGTASGINPSDGASRRVRYAFHDLLKVTNAGTRTVVLWVNATTDVTSSGQAIHVAKSTTSGSMTDSDSVYYDSSATGLSLTVGSSAYVGVRIKTGTVSSGSIGGTVTLDARAS